MSVRTGHPEDDDPRATGVFDLEGELTDEALDRMPETGAYSWSSRNCGCADPAR